MKVLPPPLLGDPDQIFNTHLPTPPQGKGPKQLIRLINTLSLLRRC